MRYDKKLNCPICGRYKSLEPEVTNILHGPIKIKWVCSVCGAYSDKFDVEDLPIHNWEELIIESVILNQD